MSKEDDRKLRAIVKQFNHKANATSHFSLIQAKLDISLRYTRDIKLISLAVLGISTMGTLASVYGLYAKQQTAIVSEIEN